MIKNWKAGLASLVLSVSMFGAGAAFTSVAQAQTPGYNQYGSNHNLLWVRSRLEGLIDQLQRDRHDYDGHRVAAIADLQQARAQLDQGLQYDHGQRR